MLHKDSSGEKVMISPNKHMLMGAGKSFFHEESTPEGPVGLQIFIHPEKADLEPRVQFSHDERKAGEWNLIAGSSISNASLEVRQQIFIYDYHGNVGDPLTYQK